MILVHVYFRPGMDTMEPEWHQQILGQGSVIQNLVAKAACVEVEEVMVFDVTQVWPLSKEFPDVLVKIDASIELPASVRDALGSALGQVRQELGKLPGFNKPGITHKVC